MLLPNNINPVQLALQTAKKVSPQIKKPPLPSLTTQQTQMQSNMVQSQQPQAPSATIVNPLSKIGGISSPFGAPNINSAPMLWGATPKEIGTTAKQLQSLPKTIPETGSNTDVRGRLSKMGGDIVLRGKGLADIRKDYPEFSHIDDETFKKIGGDIALRGKGIDDILKDYPELQGGQTDLAKKAGLGLIGGVGALAGSSIGGEFLQKVGKKVYGLTLPPGVDEARKIQSYNAGTSNIKPRTTVTTAMETPTLMGTRSMIGTQAERQASNIFKKTINPLLEKAKTTINVQGAIKELKSKIGALAGLDPDKLDEYTQAIDELEQSFKDKKYSDMSLKDTNVLKKSLQGRTPQKFWKGKEITNAYQELRGQLSTIIKDKLHSSLKKDYGVDTAKKYLDRANLDSLSEVGIKAKTQGGLKGGFGGFWSTILEEVATPITTTSGKLLYNVGGGMKAIPAFLMKNGKKLLNPDMLKGFIKAEAGKVGKGLMKGGVKSGPAMIMGIVMPDLGVNKSMNTPEDDKIYIKGGDKKIRVSKDKFKFDKGFNKKVYKTELGTIDEQGNIRN